MKRKQDQKGFTLIELMIVVVIIAILAAVGYPAYTDQVESTRRDSMKGTMMELAAALEHYRAQRFSYSGADANVPMPSNDYFDVAVVVDGDNRGYTVTATPKGVMAGTGGLVMNSDGQTCFVKGATTCTPGTDPAW